MKIGIMGGTFDPPHLGHTLPVREAVRQFALRQVWFLPNNAPPHKVRPNLTDGYHRAAMLALALMNHPDFLIRTTELKLEKPAFTYDTIRLLKSEYPRDSFFFIMGTDSFLEIDTWRRYSELIDLCEFIIINRGDQEEKLKQNLQHLETTLQKKLGNIFHFTETAFIPVSSTAIRAALSEGKSVTGMLSEEVEAYILKHSLYQRRDITSD
jgi:nicotinate-nucleotide adenylyltransferase